MRSYGRTSWLWEITTMPIKWLVTWLILTVTLSSPILAAVNDGDNFNDNTKKAALWGTDEISGSGILAVKNHRLEYTCHIPAENNVNRPWDLTRLPYNTDWEMQVDVFNNTLISSALQITSFGVLVRSPLTADNDIYAELYSSGIGGGPKRNGFRTDLSTAASVVASSDTGELPATNSAVRMTFNSTTKVITVFYDLDVTDDYQWVEYGSFGLAGSGGASGSTDWGLSATNQFPVLLYGYSLGVRVNTGELYGDNFRVTGGVAPIGSVAGPTGSFGFAFPGANPLLTAIVNLTGNYTGVSPTVHARQYNIDVAQDESGKLSALGTIENVQDKNGGADLSGNIGSVKTVKGEPTIELGGKFSGIRDGASIAVTGTAELPAVVTDVGGGTDGLVGTVSYRGKTRGIPFSGKEPVQIAAPPGSVANLKKDWTLQLDITSKLSKTKKWYLAASLTLLLPNGDTIAFPEKKVKYHKTTGYSVRFINGTNGRLSRIDRQTWIWIKGMTLTQQADVWQPTGQGTITYRFLGQKGTGNLTDFLPI